LARRCSSSELLSNGIKIFVLSIVKLPSLSGNIFILLTLHGNLNSIVLPRVRLLKDLASKVLEKYFIFKHKYQATDRLSEAPFACRHPVLLK